MQHWSKEPHLIGHSQLTLINTFERNDFQKEFHNKIRTYLYYILYILSSNTILYLIVGTIVGRLEKHTNDNIISFVEIVGSVQYKHGRDHIIG